LEWINVIDAEGVADITIFKDLPKLKRISIKKGQYAEEQTEVLGKKVSAN
ncbi:MAG: hypothetical protein GX843_00255, partial [Synergistaceae bacterium]|nr:hypothetical protein [Synergistaceae bacterium]